MPSFDIVSEYNLPEVINAVDQANREVSTRFDFKGSGAEFEFNKDDNKIILHAPSKFQLEQMLAILQNKMSKRGIDVGFLDIGEASESLHKASLEVKLKQGLEQDFAKKIVKEIKGMSVKVQAAIQGEQIRVTGKKRDDLQAVIAHLRQAEFEQPLQYENFRD